MSPDWPGQRPTAVMVTWGLLSILITLPGPLSSTFSRRGDRGREVKAVPRTHNWKGTKMRPPVLDVFHLPLGSNTTFSTLLHAPRAWPYGLHQWLPHPPPSAWVWLTGGMAEIRKWKERGWSICSLSVLHTRSLYPGPRLGQVAPALLLPSLGSDTHSPLLPNSPVGGTAPALTASGLCTIPCRLP